MSKHNCVTIIYHRHLSMIYGGMVVAFPDALKYSALFFGVSWSFVLAFCALNFATRCALHLQRALPQLTARRIYFLGARNYCTSIGALVLAFRAQKPLFLACGCVLALLLEMLLGPMSSTRPRALQNIEPALRKTESTGWVLRLTKSSQTPRCRRKSRLPLKNIPSK